MRRRFARLAAPGGPAWAEIAEGVARELDAAPWAGGRPTGEVLSAELPRLAPFAGTKIVGIGSNYRAHAAEMGRPIPVVPKLFLKAPSAVLDPGGCIELPPGTRRVDHEGELGVVIGRRARRVAVGQALEHVFGYTAVNDVTARDLQQEDGVFARAKGFDTFCPVGPEVVTGLDPRAIGVECAVNGVVRQRGYTSDLVFDVATLIAFVSAVMTLEPGDLIATGTPAGVGPLIPGDRVAVTVAGVGTLDNLVVDRDDR